MEPKKKTLVTRVEYWDCGVHVCDTYHQTKEAAINCFVRSAEKQKHKKEMDQQKAWRAERDRDILAMRRNGFTRKAIAEKHNLSTHRIFQIECKAARNERAKERADERRAEVEQIGIDVDVFEQLPIDWMMAKIPLSVRTSNCMKNARIKTVGDLMAMSEDALLKTKNFGKKSLKEIREAKELARYIFATEKDGVQNK